MEVFALLIGLFVLLTFFMPWINHSRICALKSEIRELKLQVEAKASSKQSESQSIAAKTPETKATVKKESKKAEKIRTSPPTSVPVSSGYDWIRTGQESFERNVATKLPVWIGAISLIFAAFFLVKYSIELGWMKPFVRVSIGGIFGMSLLAAGQWIVKREYIANYERISQGLVGAGLVALYVSIYAAINLYDLLPSILAFGAMTAVTVLAVMLSLRHGQPIAVFGLIGGLLTPAVIGSEEPNAIAMFAYLFVLFSGMFMVLVRKGWWILALVAVIGVFSWSAFWFLMVFAASDAIVLVLFAIAIVGVILSVTGKRIAENKIDKEQAFPIHALNMAALVGGVLTIGWLSLKISLGLFDWSMLGLFSIALMTLAYFQPAVYQKPLWAKLGAGLFLYFVWAHNAPLSNALAVLFGFTVIYVGGSAFLMRQVKDPRFWAGLQTVAVISLYLISYFAFDLPKNLYQSFNMFWGITSLILAGLATFQAADIRLKFKANDVIKEHLVAIYALLASALISCGLAIELPWEHLPLAIAAQIAVTALVFNRTKIEFLKQIIFVLTLGFIALNLEQIILFRDIIFMSFEGKTPRLSEIKDSVLDAPFIKLGIPAVLLGMSQWILLRNKNKKVVLDHVVFGTVLSLVLMTFYYLFRYLAVSAGDYAVDFSTEATFIERGVISIVIAGFGYALLQGINRLNYAHLKPWAIGLLSVAAARYAGFDLLMHNPYWDGSQNVGTIPFFNGVTLTYGAATLLFSWAVYSKSAVCSKDTEFGKTLCKAFGFISLFVFSSLTVKQLFHGGELDGGSIGFAEMYAYSAAWLFTGLAVLAFGILKESKTARLASLAFMVLTVLKVFLFDASELEGLYRVFSFLGLGVSLIGLSYFYTKLVFKGKG